MEAALLSRFADDSVCSTVVWSIDRATAFFGASPQVCRCAVMGEETAGQDYGRSCASAPPAVSLLH